VNPTYFDNSVFDIYSSIFTGASLVPFTVDEMKYPDQVLSKINECGCTIFFSVPSLLIYFQTLKLLNKNSFKNIRSIIFGGEGYPKVKLKELFELFKSRCQLFNVYGPTECTCICSVYTVSDIDFNDLNGYPPLGEMIPGFSCFITNNDKLTCCDETGELWLKGPSVGLGYYNDRNLTEKSFIKNPFNEKDNQNIYKTGDIVKYNSKDKKIYFVGRKDNQIKHQGYRIELGEIEYALLRVDGVDEAVAAHTIKDGVSTIIGFISSKTGIKKGQAISEVSKYIPKYMIPSIIDIYDFLPKNANGKIDRNLLKNGV
jgi:D-alanine--poly(phosphoribitol) ligase subunit 1